MLLCNATHGEFFVSFQWHQSHCYCYYFADVWLNSVYHAAFTLCHVTYRFSFYTVLPISPYWLFTANLLKLPFNSWLDGEAASTDINRLKEVVKLEQLTNCLPTEINRWVVEKRPKLWVDAAKLAEEFAVLYKPFKAEQGHSWKSDDKNYAAKTDKSFHKNWGSWKHTSEISQ